MNKNHFIIPYSGNKRTEVKEIYNALNFENIEYICEPFCGTSAISYYISTLHPKKFTYIFNDIDSNLIKMYELMKDKIKWNQLCVLYQLQLEAINNKEFYKKIINQKGIISYLIRNKYYDMRSGLYPSNGNRKKKPLTNDYPIVKFMREEKVILHNTYAKEILQKYNKKNTMFIMDPPYLFTCNSFYNDADMTHKNFNIYEHIYWYGKDYKCPIYFVLEKMWFIDSIFGKKIVHTYKKSYTGIRKKVVDHCIIKI